MVDIGISSRGVLVEFEFFSSISKSLILRRSEALSHTHDTDGSTASSNQNRDEENGKEFPDYFSHGIID